MEKTIRVSIDSTGARRGGAEAEQALNGIKRSAGTADTALRGVDAQARATAFGMGVLRGAVTSLAGAFGAAFALNAFIKNTNEADAAMAQLTAAVKSTGGAAGLTVKQLDEMAGKFQDVTTYSDDAVKSMESILLTFTKVGGDTFPRASAAILDLSTRMGGDLKGAALQVGKALNDPIEGISALTRVGVSFTEAQKDMIKSLAESGRMAEAQALILKELETEFGGSAAAARDTFGGSMIAVMNAFGDQLEISSEKTRGLAAAMNYASENMGKILTVAATVGAGLATYLLAPAVAAGAGIVSAFVASSASAIAFEASVIASMAGVSASMTAAALAAGVLRGAIALALGPVGIAIAAATAAYLYLTRNTKDATDATIEQIKEQEALSDTISKGLIVSKAEAEAKLKSEQASLRSALATRNEMAAVLELAQQKADILAKSANLGNVGTRRSAIQDVAGFTNDMADNAKLIATIEKNIAGLGDTVKNLTDAETKAAAVFNRKTEQGNAAAAAKESDAALKALEDRYKSLTESLDPALARQNKYNESIQTLNAAVEAGLPGAAENLANFKALADGILTQPLDDAVALTQQQNAELELTLQGRASEIDYIRISNALKKEGVNLEDEGAQALMNKLRSNLEYNDQLKKQVEAQKRSAEQIERIYDNAAENIQRSFATTFRGIFDKGIKSFGDLKRSILDIFKDMAAQLLAANFFSGFAAQFRSAVSGAGGYDPSQAAKKGGIAGLVDMSGTEMDKLLKPWGDIFKTSVGPMFKDLGKTLGGLFEGVNMKLGNLGGIFKNFGSTLGTLGAAYGVGSIASSVGGAVSNLLGIGGTGKKALQGAAAGAAIGTFVLPGIGTIGGALIGGAVGLISSLFGGKKYPRSQAALTSDSYTTFANDGQTTATGEQFGKTFLEQLNSIATNLGGKVVKGKSLGTVGQRGEEFFFDNGPNQNSKDVGDNQALRYKTADEALAAAIKSALVTGAVSGLSDTIAKALKNGKKVDDVLSFGNTLAQVTRNAASANDNLKSALTQLNDETLKAIDLFKSVGASADEMLTLEKSYQKDRAAIIENGNNGAIKSLKSYLFALEGGTSSPLSARDRANAAQADLAPIEAAIRAGKSFDFEQFQSSSQALLAAQRDQFGGTQAYFDSFNEIRELTKLAISASQNVATLPTEINFAPVVTAVQQTNQNIVTGNAALIAELRALFANGNYAGLPRYYGNVGNF